MKQTRIISAFPGTGKTSIFNSGKYDCLDSDSSEFSWVVNEDGQKVRNPDFPENYIAHIKENIGKVDLIFVSTHKDVRDALQLNCLFFYLLYPKKSAKEEYLRRYKDRNSSEAFINLLSDNWDNWIRECEFCERGCKQIEMDFPYLANEVSHIICSEGGDSL